MTNEQILKVLKNERECIARQGTHKCNRWCGECDLCLPDNEILEVYDFLIHGYELTEIPIPVSREEAHSLLSIMERSRFAVYPLPDVGESYPTLTVTTPPDEYGREHFQGICPYTNKKCDTWTCGICEIGKRERKFAEGDTEC